MSHLSPETEAEIKSWDAQYMYRYSEQNPHPLFTCANYDQWFHEVYLEFKDEFLDYERWVRVQLVEIARRKFITGM
jgi:hypothetical protein